MLVGSDQGTKGQTMSVIELSWTDKKIIKKFVVYIPNILMSYHITFAFVYILLTQIINDEVLATLVPSIPF